MTLGPITITAEALIRFGERYADLAAKQAAAESNPQRKAMWN